MGTRPNYEQQPEFPLQRVENKAAHLDWRVEAMKLAKDRSAILYNDWLTLAAGNCGGAATMVFT